MKESRPDLCIYLHYIFVFIYIINLYIICIHYFALRTLLIYIDLYSFFLIIYIYLFVYLSKCINVHISTLFIYYIHCLLIHNVFICNIVIITICVLRLRESAAYGLAPSMPPELLKFAVNYTSFQLHGTFLFVKLLDNFVIMNQGPQ